MLMYRETTSINLYNKCISLGPLRSKTSKQEFKSDHHSIKWQSVDPRTVSQLNTRYVLSTQPSQDQLLINISSPIIMYTREQTFKANDIRKSLFQCSNLKHESSNLQFNHSTYPWDSPGSLAIYLLLLPVHPSMTEHSFYAG
jgi:hypothetical protein